MTDRSLQSYYDQSQQRLERATKRRAWAALAITVLIACAVAAWVSIQLGFPARLQTPLRFLIIVSIAISAYAFWLRPLRQIRHAPARAIEALAPDLNGRLETWNELPETHPFRELIERDSAIARAAWPPERQTPPVEIVRPTWIAVVAVALLGWLTFAGPYNMNHGLQMLVAGWALPELRPPMRLNVSPGDDAIRRGGNIKIRVQPIGFEPAMATVNVQTADGDWRELPMSGLADQSFDATLYGQTEDLRYFVRADQVRSETFSVKVVDAPEIESIAATYHYPAWTGRESETVASAGDLRAPRGTEVELTVTTVTPAETLVLIHDELSIAMEASDVTTHTTRLRIDADGQYFIGAVPEQHTIRLSDDYFISLLQDRRPSVSFARPGRDWKASNIEEVTTEIEVRDDFNVEQLIIRYAVNGGDWQEVELPAGQDSIDAKHLFYLEAMGDATGEMLVPGDLVSYYAEATDRQQSVQTDMFFIEVQPFDKRYSQSQQSGGAGGDNGLGDEISARQREIIVSTWNLIREQANPTEAGDSYIPDNANLLAELQLTLRQQAQTLADRARARQLADDGEIATFISYLEAAAEAMQPASEKLAAVEFRDALLPEQEALQHLLRAEAVFRDITVSQNSGSPGGGQAGRDLSEMFEMEMDLEKNQYETGSVASAEEPSEALDEIAEQLAELARRQEALQQRLAEQQTPSAQERWEQERLRRETEELERQLESLVRRSQQTADDASPANTQTGEPAGQTAQSGEPSRQTTESGEPEGSESSTQSDGRTDELQRRVQSALRAMRESSEALDERSDAAQANAAAAEAARQLAGASREARNERARSLTETLNRLTADAEELVKSQQQVADQVQSLAEQELASDDGFSDRETARAAAAGKREVHANLEDVEQRLRDVLPDIGESDPGASDQLASALQKLADLRVKERLALSALYVENDEARYVASSESMITSAIENLSEAIAQAEIAHREPDTDDREPTLADAVREVQDLREALTSGSEATGEQLTNATRVVDRAVNGERARLDFDTASEIRSLRRALLASDPDRNGLLLDDEASRAVALAEQLELALRHALQPTRTGATAADPERVAPKDEAAVAEYFRQLAEQSTTQP